jgi:hypothetical protein
MWVQDAMVLAATWLRCSDLLGHFLEQPCGPRRTAANASRPPRPPDLKVRQQRSTAATALANTFGLIQMPLANVNKATNGDCAEFGRMRILRGPDPGPIPRSALSSNASDWSAMSPQNAV